MQTTLSFNDAEKRLLIENADAVTNWVWSDKDKARWEPADEYMSFYEYWRRSDAPSSFLSTFPYKLSLGVDSNNKCLLPFHRDESSDQILVTKSYNTIFHRLLRLREGDIGTTKGAVLTGQPGAGKTTYQKFMLARLIATRQVVLLCNNSSAHLFYCGQVYRRPMDVTVFERLPTHKNIEYCPILALIDVDYNNRGPPITDSSNIWPIQTSSPNPVRWKAWSKQNKAAMLGMPLWSIDELAEGLRLHREYNGFRSKLEKVLNTSTHPTSDVEIEIEQMNEAFSVYPNQETDTDKTGKFGIDNILLEILQAERERRKAEEKDNEMGDDISASAADQDENMVDDDEVQVPAVDTALMILLHNAIEEFGRAPRDVFDGVFRFDETKTRHARYVGRLDYSTLSTLVRAFSHLREPNEFFHHVLVMYPEPIVKSLRVDKWIIDFKSNRIACKVMELMQSEEDVHLRHLYSLLHQTPESSILAGRIFKVL